MFTMTMGKFISCLYVEYLNFVSCKVLLHLPCLRVQHPHHQCHLIAKMHTIHCQHQRKYDHVYWAISTKKLATVQQTISEPENFPMAQDAVLAADHAELLLVHNMVGGVGMAAVLLVDVPCVHSWYWYFGCLVGLLLVSVGFSYSNVCCAWCTTITGGINDQPMWSQQKIWNTAIISFAWCYIFNG